MQLQVLCRNRAGVSRERRSSSRGRWRHPRARPKKGPRVTRRRNRLDSSPLATTPSLQDLLLDLLLMIGEPTARAHGKESSRPPVCSSRVRFYLNFPFIHPPRRFLRSIEQSLATRSHILPVKFTLLHLAMELRNHLFQLGDASSLF